MMLTSMFDKTRRAVSSVAAGAVLLGLAVAFVPSAGAPAQALDETCWLGADGSSQCTDDTEPAGAEPMGSGTLLTAEAYASMTPEQAGAMRRLEDQAVDVALQLHQLPAGDAPYLKSWERDEVVGLLQKLVFKAAGTPEAERTPDERLVAAWIGDGVQRRVRDSRFQEGAEYVRWAGLDMGRYWELVNGGASRQVLTDFLSQPPKAMNGPTLLESTGGYCVYRPPGGYTDYDPNTFQVCHLPCQTSTFGCMPEPTVEQFVMWGAARAKAYDRTDDEALTVDGAHALVAASHAGFVAREILRHSVLGRTLYTETLFKLNPKAVINKVLADGATDLISEPTAVRAAYDAMDKKFVDELAKKIAPFQKNPAKASALAIRARITNVVMNATDGLDFQASRVVGHQMSKIAGEVTERLTTQALRLANMCKGLAASWGADFLVFNVTALIDASFFLDANLKRPGRIAGHVVYARDLDLDPYSWTFFDWGRNLLRFEFMNAVAPYPASYPVRQAPESAPQFLVRDPDGGHREQTATLHLGRVEEDSWTPVSLRVSGRWVVERWWHPEQGLQLQSLALRYTNHELQDEVAYLVPQDDGDYAFFVVSPDKPGFDMDTCREDGTCWDAEELEYLDPDGNPRIARLEGYRPPTGEVTVSTSRPAVGEYVSFGGNLFRPGGAEGTVTYRWRFQREGCGGVAGCVTWSGGAQVPWYSDPLTGTFALRRWANAGTYHVEVTANDSMGRRAVKTLTVAVGG